MIEDWAFRNIRWIVLSVCGLILWVMLSAYAANEDNRKAFMAECLEARPQYECTAMWRR